MGLLREKGRSCYWNGKKGEAELNILMSLDLHPLLKRVEFFLKTVGELCGELDN